MIPELHPREAERLQALYSLEILDTAPEAVFQNLVDLAALVCGTPIALISLVDKDRQWLKARHGLDVQQTSRDISFCGHAILRPGAFVVPDAAADPRFQGNPLVQGNPSIRFYAAIPLSLQELPLGTLCVIDRVPRTLTEDQQAALKLLASHVETLFSVRRRILDGVSAEARVDAWQRREAQILNALPLAVVAFDRQGAPVVANDASRALLPELATRINGSGPGLGPSDESALPAPGLPIQRALAGEAVSFRGLPLNRSGSQRLLKGTATPLLEDGNVALAIAAFWDATEEIQTERALTEHEREFHDLFEYAGDLIQSVDESGRFEYVNRSWREALGYEAVDLKALTMLDVIHPDSLEHCLCVWRSLGPRPVLIEAAFRTKSGDKILLEGSASRGTSPSGQARTRGFFRNVTERTKREQELRTALEDASRANRAKTEFLSRMSHDLRTPLNAVLGFAELMEMGGLSVEHRGHVGHILRSGSQLLERVDELLSLSHATLPPAQVPGPESAGFSATPVGSEGFE